MNFESSKNSNDETKNWDDRENTIIQHEKFFAAVKKIREPNIPKEGKKWWHRVLESKVLAVLITVAIGGIFGNIINSNIQKGLKEREFQHDLLKALNTTQLELQKEYFKKQVEEAKTVFVAVGNIIKHTGDLAIIKTPPWSLESAKTEKEKKTLLIKRTGIRDAYNDSFEKWETNQNMYGIILSFYFYGDSEVLKAWHTLCDKIEEFINWASIPNESKKYTIRELERREAELASFTIKLQRSLLEARSKGITDWGEKVKSFF